MLVMQEEDYYLLIIYSSTEAGSWHTEKLQRMERIGLADLKNLN